LHQRVGAKTVFAVGALIILIVGVAGLVFLSQTRQEDESLARGPKTPVNTVSLSLSSATSKITVGQQMPINITMNAGTFLVGAATLSINYPPDLFSFVSFNPTPCLPVVLTAASVSAGVASVTLGSQPGIPTNGTCKVAVLTLQALSVSKNPATISFNPQTQVAVAGTSTSMASFSNQLRLQIN